MIPRHYLFISFGQFKCLSQPKVCVLPTKLESLPQKLRTFDTVFYGCSLSSRSPFDHLQLLYEATADGGQVILETLVIDGDEGDVLIPEGRYSNMGNVWFIPSVPSLCKWLKK